ncbi:MAG TPA: tRNA uridine(34) 5-carboxymethylaminomethyl modification radical SAM/GNAT enzyme Elp3 [Candidatus Woesearchaeota archaeon]|nr:tRNA uridine(34) 5-carboxymethylaminomethyl modification radical SAM/GNAT enzyme Elp3 [Candidatus Woesearchaeota archaeon]
MNLLEELLSEIRKRNIKTKSQLVALKSKLARKYGYKKIPSNAEIFEMADKKQKELLRMLLRIKPVRSISGVTVIAVMTPPAPCPHGKCTYCPSAKNVPESYTGKEPAARRGKSLDYDPYNQVQNRLKQLQAIGHLPQKCELIIMGGTFPARPEKEQVEFVKQCLLAMNEFNKAKKIRSKTLEEVQKKNEKAKVRCVGMTFETRPDYCGKKEIELMLKLGATRVELGVQTIYDEIYKKINRGHTVQDVVDATKRLKDAGLKVLYHIMPCLPGSSYEKDLAMFNGSCCEKCCMGGIFGEDRFRPDMLKIYPCLVIKGTKLYDDWKAGKYVPCTEKDMIKLIRKIKEECPEWIRIMRVERDIPGTEIEAGVKATNLRQMLGKTNCQCIRCREIGHRELRGIKLDKKSVHLNTIVYTASGGKEVFLEFIDKNRTLLGFLRLRLNNSSTALVRELHVYGEHTLIGKSIDIQHKGYGKKLLKESEKISKIAGKKKISVTSGIGVRDYYRKLSYHKDKTYMSKTLK